MSAMLGSSSNELVDVGVQCYELYSLFELDLDDIIIVVYGDGWANVSLLYLNTDKFK